MAKGKKTGGKNFEHGKSGNPGGLTKDQKNYASDFRSWAFSVWKEHADDFKALALTDEKCGMQFLKMLADMCPKEVSVGNTDDKPFLLKVVK